MSKHVTMQQWQDDAHAFARSALAAAPLPKAAGANSEGAGLVLKELPLCGLLTLRAHSENASLSKALKNVLKLDLPEALQADQHGLHCVRWMSPDEWLISCPIESALDVESSLREALSGHVALVNVSCGYQCLELSGSDVLTVLQKSTAYDVHPMNFTVGKVVNTTFAKTQITLRCVDAGRYEVIVRRSFAHYLLQWLSEASREHGLSISG